MGISQRRTRRRKQHGGSKRYITIPDVHDTASMFANVSIQYLFGHGRNLMDKYLVVPENTYVYYVGRSGEETDVEDIIAFTRSGRNADAFYAHIFTNAEPKSIEPYPGAHVYVPGDILPMSAISFFDDAEFPLWAQWPKGVYEPPFSAGFQTYIGRGGDQTMIHLEPLGSKYPSLPRLIPYDVELPPLPGAVAGSINVTTALNQLLSRDATGRIAYLEDFARNYGFSEAEVYDPTFWFRNPEALVAIKNEQSYAIPGNLLRTAHPELPNHEITLAEILRETPSTKPYRLFIVNSCRGVYGIHSDERVTLAKRFSSASKHPEVKCVTSERRNPVFNIAAIRESYRRLIPLYNRLKPHMKDVRSLTALWRLQSRFFYKDRRTGDLMFNTFITPEAIYDAIDVVNTVRPNDLIVTRIDDADIKEAVQETAEAIRAAFLPVEQRIEREFAAQNRRATSKTKFLKYTLGRTTRYAKRGDPTGNAGNRRNV